MTKLQRLRAKFEAIDEVCELFYEIGWLGVAKVQLVDTDGEWNIDSVEVEKALATFRTKIQTELFAEENSVKMRMKL